MANKKHHHIFKRDKMWHFRKDGVRFSLETTIATEAMRKRDNLLENYRLTGQFVIADDQDVRPTFGSVAKEWANIHKKKVKYTTWRDYRSAMNTHVLPIFKDTPIDDISYMNIENFISKLDCSGKRINNILVPMRSVFKMAFKNGYVQENVMDKVDNRPVKQSKIFPLTYEEIRRFIDAVDPHYRPYSTVLFFTGMREGEINGLNWSDYKPEMEKPKLHINKSYVYGKDGNTKTEKSNRYVDCLDIVVETLEEQRKITGQRGVIFTKPDGGRMNPDHYRNVVWKKAIEKAGMKYRPPIQARHTFATMMISAGEELGWVQNMLGHSSLQMIFTRYYAWIPNNTRNNGTAFKNFLEEKSSSTGEKTVKEKTAEIIHLFSKNDTKTTQSG